MEQRIRFGWKVKPPRPVHVWLIFRVATFFAEDGLEELDENSMLGKEEPHGMDYILAWC